MDLKALVNYIDSALIICQSTIEKNPNVVLSEADFERLTANCISRTLHENVCYPNRSDFSVHTQISHYIDGNVHPDVRPDILLLRERELAKAFKDYIPHKKDKYDGASVAIELKYLHVGDGVSIVQHDFDKWKTKLDENTWLYVIVLLDTPLHPRNIQYYENKEAKIYQQCNKMKEDYPNDKERLYCKVLKKITE